MLTNAKCRLHDLHLSSRTSKIFRNLSSRCTYTRTTQLGIIRGEKKKKRRFITAGGGWGWGGAGGEGGPVRDRKRACHLIDCAGPRGRARGNYDRVLSLFHRPSIFRVIMRYVARRTALLPPVEIVSRGLQILAGPRAIKGRATLNYRARSKLNIVVTTARLRHDGDRAERELNSMNSFSERCWYAR